MCVKDFLGKGVRFDKGNVYHCGKDGCLQEFDSGAHICIVEELYEYFRLWTIQDAKDGDVLGDKLTTMSKVIQCPHRVTFDGMIYHCMQGHFPIDCENCDCKDKKWVEVWSDINAREI